MRIGTTIERSSDDSVLESQIFTYQATITNACPAGINNVNNDLISLFPNPTGNELSITGLTYGHNVVIEVLDVQGRLISTQNTIASNQLSLRVSWLTTGLYLLKITDAQSNQTSVKRFSKL